MPDLPLTATGFLHLHSGWLRVSVQGARGMVGLPRFALPSLPLITTGFPSALCTYYGWLRVLLLPVTHGLLALLLRLARTVA